MTAVMFAVRQRNFEILQYLVEFCGADINHRNQVLNIRLCCLSINTPNISSLFLQSGQSAMDIAQEMQLEMIAYYLYKQSPLSMRLEDDDD